MRRKQNFQTIAWFWDLYQRDLLDLDPPYQRRSIWNQAYKDYFIDTILLGYPAPAIFLYEQIEPDGRATYHVVDGKQRLTTIFEFASNQFPVGSTATASEFRDKYFNDLSTEAKRDFWAYPFSVEYIPTENETIIDNVFDRINRNTAKLTSQELRHAKYSGEFISAAEDLSEWMTVELGEGFPNIAAKSRRQMKDVELVAHLLLLIERGPRGYSTSDLDHEFSARDEIWEPKVQIEKRFRRAISCVEEMLSAENGDALRRSRMRNQADFYSLVGALDRTMERGKTSNIADWGKGLVDFSSLVEDEASRGRKKVLQDYYEAARSASNDTGPRQTRIDILARVLCGASLEDEDS